MARKQTPKGAPQENESTKARKLLDAVLRVPRIWLCFVLMVAALSTLDISIANDAIAFQGVHVGSTTALFLALVWLPSLVRLFAYAGGAIKTPMGEMRSDGLRRALLQVADDDSLGLLIERANRAEMESSGARREQARAFRQELQEVYEARVPSEDARKKLDELAQQYHKRRVALPSGNARTIELDAVIGGMLATAPAANLSDADIAALLQSDHDGQRLEGLAAAISFPDTRAFPLVLQMIANSKSAFEQYYAIVAMQRLAHQLNGAQRNQLREVLHRQRDYDPDRHQHVKPGSKRWRLTDQLLEAIGERG